MKEIELTNGQVALVDDEDYEFLMLSGPWFAHKSGYTTYARSGKRFGRQMMHRVILGLEFSSEPIIDHIGQDGLDNRRANIRVATPSINMSNRRMSRNNTSGYRGVSWHRRIGKWAATIRRGGRNRFLGYFEDAVDAAKAYDSAVKRWRDGHATTNF